MIFAVLLIAAPSLSDLLPCTVGQAIEYKVIWADGKEAHMIETVLGPGKEPNTCTIDRVTIGASGREQRDRLLREQLPDRILNAGFADQVVAFRPPLLVLPIEKGTKWRFQGVDHVIEAINEKVETPAGVFEACVRVRERSRDGSHDASSVYAPNVGLIAYESRDRRIRATRVDTKNSKKTSK